MLGYFNSNILGSNEGYITPPRVAVPKSYLYWEYPLLIPFKLEKETLSTDWTPITPPIRLDTSDIIIGWLTCHLSILK